MKKSLTLKFVLVGLVLLALSVALQSPEAAIAIDSTPTPTIPAPVEPLPPDQPPGLRCQMAQDVDCLIFDPMTQQPIGLPDQTFARQTFPLAGAQGVPTRAWISMAFGASMAPETISNDTFFVTANGQRIQGQVSYLESTQMAVFQPAQVLAHNTIYTARVTREVRYSSGLPLEQEVIWEFTTTSGSTPLSEDMTAVGVPFSDNLNIYLGDLHSHTIYSDGRGTPLEAYNTARARGLDFFGLSEHAFMLTQAEWESLGQIADSVTVEGQFLGLRGFEYTNDKGHLNVFNTGTFVHKDDPNYNTLPKFYNWLLTQPNVVAQFNHPFVDSQFDFNFNNFAYYPLIDHKIVLQELTDPKEFLRSNNVGWHLGSIGTSDAHRKDWGLRRLGVLAPALNKDAIFQGLRARRTFFLSPHHLSFSVLMRANGYWMGSSVPNTAGLNFIIQAHDPTPEGKSLTLKLYESGSVVAQKKISSREWYKWTPSISAKLGRFYYVEAYYEGWLYPAYTSPIWVERQPVAEAGSSQLVRTAAAVTLNGLSSFDPDGQALLYRWTQKSGPAVSLNKAQTAQPNFTAPNAPGELTFQLDVLDPGGLSHSDTVGVSITDKPILTITKTGPATAKPGELITYVLTVGNVGSTAANNVVVVDTIPSGAKYVNGGNSIANGVVSWNIPSIAPGKSAQVFFSATTDQAIINNDYRAQCQNCIPAVGTDAVLTNGRKIYLPVINRKN